jgi:hypothetical protein
LLSQIQGHVVLNCPPPVLGGHPKPDDKEEANSTRSTDEAADETVLKRKRTSEDPADDASSSSSAQSQLKRNLEAKLEGDSGMEPKGPSCLKLKGAMSSVPLQSAPPVPTTKKLRASDVLLVPKGWDASLLDISSQVWFINR